MTKLAALLISIFLATAVQAADIATLITEQAEVEYGPEIPVNGRFDIRMTEELPLEADYVSDFWMDRDSGRFIAIVVSETGSKWRISGGAILVLPVPVVNRQLLPDEIISASDLQMIELPYARVNTFAVTEPKKIIGMQVRRVLAKGRPILQQSIIPPIVISRGARVTIRVQSGALSITAQGKSLSDAYLGQIVRVVNLESNKTISGVARSNSIVEIIN